MKAVLCLCLVVGCLRSAEVLPEDRGAAGLHHALKQLSTDARVLYITAHPDDEDPALLTYLSRGLGASVTLLILNRGEGGANVVSGDFFESLGVLRTAEMLKAAQYYGVGVRFTRAVDYGYSKQIGEALRQWKEDELLADVLRITRQVQPHVIISRFNESERDGHGHHQTAGRMARRVFAATANDTWKPLKLYTTNWREGEAVTLKINTGQYDPVLGRSYAQIGRDGYRWHRSQGMAANIPRPGPVWAFLKLEGSRVGDAMVEQDVFERIPVRVEDAEIAAVWRQFDAREPERCAPQLIQALKRLPQRRAAIEKALVRALGVEFEALVEPDVPATGPFAMFRPVETLQVAQAGQQIQVRMVLHVRGRESVEGVGYAVKGPATLGTPDQAGIYPLRISPQAKPTSAYWHRKDVRQAMYEIADEQLLGAPVTESGILAVAKFRYQGEELNLESDFETSSVDARSGAQRQPLAIGPPVSVQWSSSFGLVPLGKRSYELTVVVRNLTTMRQQGRIRLDLPPGLTPPGELPRFDLAKENEEARLAIRLDLPERLEPRDYPIGVAADLNGAQYRAGFQAVVQPGLRTLYWSQPAVHALRAVDARVASGLRTGYVMGSGDEVPEGLRQLGVAVEMLDESALANSDLSRFSTIWVGIRAYAAREDVRRHNARLLDYVARGGVLIVQYQTQEYDRNYGPYPYTQGRGAEETSEEDAAVRILKPEAQVMRWPNRITASDFENWVEQRGSKFFSSWAAEWTPLVETGDQGQSPQRGVWLEARHGKGLYVYCSLAWYRQLPFAVTGAARIVANLASLGAADAEWRTTGK